MELKLPFKKCNEITEELKSLFIYKLDIDKYKGEMNYIVNSVKFTEDILSQNIENKILNYNPVIPGDVLYVNGEYERFYIIDFFNITPNAYVISSFGRIFSFFTNREIYSSIVSPGYSKIQLSNIDNKKESYPVHRLVAMAFIPRTEEDDTLYRMCINHIDSNGTNNDYRNLEWCTQRENMIDRNIKMDNNYNTIEDIIRVCRLLEDDKLTQKEISEITGVGIGIVSGIKQGVRYKNISKDFNIPDSNKYNIDRKILVEDICKLLSKGYSDVEEILNEVGLDVNDKRNREFLYSIWNREYYTDISNKYDFKNYNKNINYITRKNKSLSESTVRKICELLSKGIDTNSILIELGMETTKANQNLVGNIRRGRSYTDISKDYDMKQIQLRNFTDEQVHAMCKLFLKGVKSSEEILRLLDIEVNNTNKHLVNEIRRGKKYNHIVSQYNLDRNTTGRKFTEEEVHDICKLLEKKYSVKDIVSTLGLEELDDIEGSINRIRRRESYSNITRLYDFDGSDHMNFTDEEVHKICRMLEMDIHPKNILESMGYEYNNSNRGIIGRIKKGTSYKEISSQYNINPESDIVLDDDTVHYICKLLQDGKNVDEILDIMNLDRDSSMRNKMLYIRKGKTFKNISSQYNINYTVKSKPRYSEDIIRKVCELLEKKCYTDKEIANMLELNFRNSGVRNLIGKTRKRELHLDISKDYDF